MNAPATTGSLSRGRPRPPGLPVLTSARFFAALAVLIFHAAGLGFLPLAPRWAQVAGQGAAGVSFFYILSGFILTYNYRSVFSARLGRMDLRQFYWARFARIYPVYIFSLAIAIPVVVYFPLGLINRAMEAHLKWGGLVATWFAHASMVSLFLPWSSISSAWNNVDWSVACEVCFYLGFPWMIFIFARRGRNLSRALLTVVVSLVATCGGIGLALLAANLRILPSAGVNLSLIAYKWPFFRVPEFLIGVFLGLELTGAEPAAWTLRLRQSASARNVMLGLALAGAVAIALAGSPRGHWGVVGLIKFLHLYWFYEVPFLVIILAMASGRTLLSPLLEHPVMVLLGEASYALYLLQAIAFTLLRLARLEGLGVGLGAVLLAMGLLLVLSIATCHYLEKPLRRRIMNATRLRVAASGG